MKSTNNQSGLNNYSTKAPKIIRKVNDEGYAGVSQKAFYVLVVWLFGSLVIIAPLAIVSQVWTHAFLGALVVWWAIYWKYMRGTKVEDFWLFVRFFFDDASGLHTIAKYDSKLSFLVDIFPLKEVHEEGLIEFTENRFGVLIRYFPERIDEESTQTFGQRMQPINDGLYGESAIKYIASSKNNMRKPILDRLLEGMNRTKNKKNFEYLKSLYELIEKKENTSIDWKFLIFFSLGKFDNLQDAIDMMEARVPGLQQSLQDEAGITTIKVVDKLEIAREYRQMCLPVVI